MKFGMKDLRTGSLTAAALSLGASWMLLSLVGCSANDEYTQPIAHDHSMGDAWTEDDAGSDFPDGGTDAMPTEVGCQFDEDCEEGEWCDEIMDGEFSRWVCVCNPSPDVCDGQDNDCDPSTPDGSDDESVGQTCDGGDEDLCEDGLTACVDGALACDDDPESTEDLCDGIDNDCNPETEDGAHEPTLGGSCDGEDADLCTNGSVVCIGGALDCTDEGATSADICDGIDNDCDPTTPDGSAEPTLGDACDGADTDLCNEGTIACTDGALSCTDTTSSTPDICDGIDNDCNPATTDGSAEATLGDACDGADTDLCNEGVLSCTAGALSCTDTTGSTPDICDGIDNDCDPTTTDGSAEATLGDACDGADTDLCNEGVLSCTAGALSCTDTTGSTPDICDGIDNDCDPTTTDGSAEATLGDACDGADTDLCDEGVLSCTAGALSCTDTTGSTPDICDGIDNDCDPTTTDGSAEATLGDACDGADTDLCDEGVLSCTAGALSCTDTTGSTPDICDGIDNDCNPSTVDGSAEATLGDACDGADTDLCNEGVLSCTAGALSCTDTTGSTPDICDGIDNDCNPSTVDGSAEATLGDACDGADTDLCNEGVLSCTAGALSCTDTTGSTPDICDGIDNDCDPDTADGTSGGCPDVPSGAGFCGDGGCDFTCVMDRADCNEIVTDGCETNLLTTAAHCGACGTTCASGEACVEGACRAPLRAISITAGDQHTCALLTTGQVQCWGRGSYGRLGDGVRYGVGGWEDPADPGTGIPVTVSGITNAVSVDAGRRHTCAVLATGQVQCWGSDTHGALGVPCPRRSDGSRIPPLGDSEYSGCAVDPADQGEVGVNGSNIPMTVSGITNALSISAGESHTCAVLATGEVRCWGENREWQLGGPLTSFPFGDLETMRLTGRMTGTPGCTSHGEDCASVEGCICRMPEHFETSLPVTVSGITNAVSVSAGSHHTCAVLTTGQVRCWGENSHGQLGGLEDNRPRLHHPVTVRGITNAVSVSAGDQHTCALLTDGELRCWGRNKKNEVGSNPYFRNRATCGDETSRGWDGDNDRICGPLTVPSINAASVSAGERYTCAVHTSGAVECWGNQEGHGLDAGSRGSRRAMGGDHSGTTYAYPVTDITNAVAVSAGTAGARSNHTCALLATGEVRCWGGSGYSAGEIGIVSGGLSDGSSNPIVFHHGAAIHR